LLSFLKDSFVQTGGTFLMGSLGSEVGRRPNEGPRDSVTVNPFFIGKYDVTVGNFMQFVRTTEYSFDTTVNNQPKWQDGSSGWLGDSYPMVMVSWYDAAHYCNYVSKLYGLDSVYTFPGDSVQINQTNNGFRLPREAEWEYACRATDSTPNYAHFYTGDSITTSQANYNGKMPYDTTKFLGLGSNMNGLFLGKVSIVGSYPPNGIGLYDMVGNVSQWCQDWSGGTYSTMPVTDPTGPATGPQRITRGGDWGAAATYLRSAYRNSLTPRSGGHTVGFRLAKNM
jgi:formylglycine-generating enzyme required for sulfatase activity